MNKKILIGSIIAVAILIMVSFTGVVGYQTTKSSTIAKASPLFTVRSSRAIDGDSKDLSCNYVGKGEYIFLSIPKRDSFTISVQKMIEVIFGMDEKRFDRFIDLIIKHIHQREDFQEYNDKEIILFLNQLKNNPSEIKPYIFEVKETKLATEVCHTDGPLPCITSDYGIKGFLGCIFYLLLLIIIIIEEVFFLIPKCISYVLNC